MSKRFTFPLQKALDWYRQRLAAEQAALQNIVNEIDVLHNLEQALERRQRGEHQLLQGANQIFGKDLRGLANYSAVIRADLNRVKAEKKRKESALAEQRRSVTMHHRRVRLLEELEERRKTQWSQQASAEQDALASELFLASIARKTARQGQEQET
jgi:hypothetical protein